MERVRAQEAAPSGSLARASWLDWEGGQGTLREGRLGVKRAEGELIDLPARPPLVLRT